MLRHHCVEPYLDRLRRLRPHEVLLFGFMKDLSATCTVAILFAPQNCSVVFEFFPVTPSTYWELQDGGSLWKARIKDAGWQPTDVSRNGAFVTSNAWAEILLGEWGCVLPVKPCFPEPNAPIRPPCLISYYSPSFMWFPMNSFKVSMFVKGHTCWTSSGSTVTTFYWYELLSGGKMDKLKGRKG